VRVLRAVLPQILSFMIVKREHAKKMLEFFEFIDSHPNRRLNHFDPATMKSSTRSISS
jgi:hypothetical protein